MSICTSTTFPSRRVDIPRLMDLMADAVAAGQVRAVGVSNYSADQMRGARRPGPAWYPARVEPGGVLAAAPAAGDQRRARCLP